MSSVEGSVAHLFAAPHAKYHPLSGARYVCDKIDLEEQREEQRKPRKSIWKGDFVLTQVHMKSISESMVQAHV